MLHLGPDTSLEISPDLGHYCRIGHEFATFFASAEGRVIETDPMIAATALMHAIGYDYYGLRKAHAEFGSDTHTPDHNPLCDLPFFVSEARPDDPNVDERTFRSTGYATERSIVTQNSEVSKQLTGTTPPFPRSIEGSNTAWHSIREYQGVSPGTTYQFVVWAMPDDEPPETLWFRTGIKQTGELVAERADTPETVDINAYLVTEVFDIDNGLITELMQDQGHFKRNTDNRIQRLLDVDREWFDTEVAPQLVSSKASA